MRAWVTQAYGDGEADNPIHALERGECTNEEFERQLAEQLSHVDGRPVRAGRAAGPDVRRVGPARPRCST